MNFRTRNTEIRTFMFRLTRLLPASGMVRWLGKIRHLRLATAVAAENRAVGPLLHVTALDCHFHITVLLNIRPVIVQFLQGSFIE
jgi:hypothetical protein